MKYLNTNVFHNLLNAATLVTSLAAVVEYFDWTTFGVEPEVAVLVAGIASLTKLVINAIRDGVSGMVKDQPPVK